MDAAARILEGTHDFAAFQSIGSDTPDAVRTLFESRITIESGSDPGIDPGIIVPAVAGAGSAATGLVVYQARGNGFLRHMVRVIAGSLVDIGQGRRSPEWFGDVLASRDRTKAGPTAPAHGLFLVRVDYGGPA